MSSLHAILAAAVLVAAATDLVDPTAPPIAAVPVIHASGPRLQAIMRMGDRALAVIDGARVSAGETVGAWQVIEIGVDAVRLRGERGELTLRLAPAVRSAATNRRGAP